MDIKTISISADILEGCTVQDYLEVTYSEDWDENKKLYSIQCNQCKVVVEVKGDSKNICTLNKNGLCLSHSSLNGLPNEVAILTIEALKNWAIAQ